MKKNTKAFFLNFYITEEEKNFKTLADETLQEFIKRINALREEATGIYYRILKDNPLNVKKTKTISEY